MNQNDEHEVKPVCIHKQNIGSIDDQISRKLHNRHSSMCYVDLKTIINLKYIGNETHASTGTENTSF